MSASRVAETREQEHAVPMILRGYRVVPRQDARHRSPAWVTPGAFRARGMAVPEDHRHLNVYRLTNGDGVPWSPSVDRHVSTRGAELLPHGELVLMDIDATGERTLEDSLRWLADRAASAGEALDLAAVLVVGTPGHEESGHLPGLHAWWRSELGRVPRFGALPGCPQIELRSRGTCPGSPGYAVRHCPDELPYLPRWLAALAPGPRFAPAVQAGTGSTALAVVRLERITDKLLNAGPGEHRRNLLYWAANRCREMADSGELDLSVASQVLFRAAEENGLVAKRGAAGVRRTIDDGLRGAR